jgi:hypothetical protein
MELLRLPSGTCMLKQEDHINAISDCEFFRS